MQDASGSSAVAPRRRSPTVRGGITVLVGVISAALLLATVVAAGDDGEVVVGARSTTSPAGTAPATAEDGDGAGGAVDHGDEAAEHLVLDLVWNDLSTEERERLCSGYQRFGLVATHESFAASYGVEGAPSPTVFRRWVEPRCGG
jgi:hypothetical protein